MKKQFYTILGEGRCRELAAKNSTVWNLLELGENPKSKEFGGRLREGIAKGFIREFLPRAFEIKSGLVFDSTSGKMSPSMDAIVYKGVPILESADVVVVEKEQVRVVFEVKSYVDTSDIFGKLENRETKQRDSNSGLAKDFKERRVFLPEGAKYVLFAFDLWSRLPDVQVSRRLKEICHSYAVVSRKTKGDEEFDYDGSVSKLINWLRNLI